MKQTSIAPAMLRLGVMGGTFDPIHTGHLIIAEEARCRLRLDRVIFVPARVSPLKLEDGTMFDNEQRYTMVCAAVHANSGFAVSRIDLDRPAPSYTVDLLRLLGDEYGPSHRYHFIMGADSLAYLPHWRDPEGIIQQARLAVVSRPGNRPDLRRMEDEIPGITAATDFLDGLSIGISSTEIRRRIANKESIRYQVPDAVLTLIESFRPRVTA